MKLRIGLGVLAIIGAGAYLLTITGSAGACDCPGYQREAISLELREVLAGGVTQETTTYSSFVLRLHANEMDDVYLTVDDTLRKKEGAIRYEKIR